MSEPFRVTGIGGVFFKARDPIALAAWYRDHLGVPVIPGGAHAMFEPAADGRDATRAPLPVAWSTFPADTAYFGPGSSGWMINYLVSDLDGMLAQLRAAGVWVSDKIEDSDFGRFGWAADPEGTRFELWQPPPDSTSTGSDTASA